MNIDIGKLTYEQTVQLAREALENLTDEDQVTVVLRALDPCALDELAAQLEGDDE